jgi:hypothetical protein
MEYRRTASATSRDTVTANIGAYVYPAASQPRPHGPSSVAGVAFTAACPGENAGRGRKPRTPMAIC